MFPSIPVGYVRGRFIAPDSTPIVGDVLFESQDVQTFGSPSVMIVPGITRVALVDGELEPLALVTGRYRVVFRFVGVGSGPVALELTTDYTATAPLDLARVL